MDVRANKGIKSAADVKLLKALPLTYEFLKLRRGKSFTDAFEKQGMLRQKTWMNAENNKICQFIIVRGIGLYHIEIIKREALFITSS